ncbi:kat8 regulatory nsl complex subunit 2-like [Plakobranchus ocellatus]|uniref:KAT8 regulatory NSL complex subunit 2 n=1 Tax=Plakobranchus ocellatus TaxID=259542 RepID=A0AAV3ZJC5_9GAST|nr:kat8 regulatory nsl complex subunit 2-like [Plakobranchus ocellatus]
MEREKTLKGMSHSDHKPQNMKSMAGSMVNKNISAMSEKDAFCKYSHRVCTQNCLEGYNFCIRHILEDKTAPYKQCAYMTKTGRRCPSAAPKQEKKEGFCSAHNRKSLLARQRLARKRRPRETGEGLLEELVALTSAAGSGGSGGTQHEHRRSKMFTDSVASRALDYASSSDSESEFGPVVEQTWRDDGDSDAESIDSDQEDLLKYAGVYTTEEVAQILRDKLIRLQALYIDQFKRLKHMLMVKRRQYLRARGLERETFGSIKLYKKDPTQRDRYNKLKALKQYHRKAGKEALLQLQSTQRRIQASAENTAGPMSPARAVTVPASAAGSSAGSSFPACTFLDDGILCGSIVVPLSKFCQKHILHDPWQLLYRPCPFADSQCGRPVPTLLNTEFCSLHQSLPPGIKLEDDKSSVDTAALETPAKSSKDTSSAPVSSLADLSSVKPEGAGQDCEIKPEIKQEVHSLLGGSDDVQMDGQSSDRFDPIISTKVDNNTSILDSKSSGTITLTDSGSSRNIDSHMSNSANAGSVNKEEGDHHSVIFTLGEEEDEDDEMDKQGR